MQASKRLLILNSTLKNVFLVSRTYAHTAASVLDPDYNDVTVKPFSEIPGPSTLPIIGQAHHFLPGNIFSDFTNFQKNFYEAFGPISKTEGLFNGLPVVFLYDADAMAYVFRSENSLPYRPGFPSLEYYLKYYNKPKSLTLLPRSLITDHGVNWRYLRNIVNALLLQPKTIKLYGSAISDVAEDMIQRMRRIRNEKNILVNDFYGEAKLWSLESIGVIALGSRLNCLNRELAEDSPEKRFILCVDDIFKFSYKLDVGLSLWRYFPSKNFRKAMKNCQDLENLIEYFVRNARKEMLAEKKPEEEMSILEKLIEIDEKLALNIAGDMIASGVETTATALTGALYLLAKNQDKQDKLREEINSEDDSMKYVRACIKESLRLLPVISGAMRLTSKDYNILGYRVPKDVLIIFNTQFLAKTESQFPRSQEFIPERWIEDGELCHKKAHPIAYAPFGFGSRNCVGRRIANLELETILTKIIKNFKVEWFGPPIQVKLILSLNAFQSPYNFVFKDLQ